MEVAELIAEYPSLYHMAEDGSWPSIRTHGLLSTSALLNLFDVHGRERFALESSRRAQSETITHPTHGKAVIRDNKPMSEGALLKCLTEGTPEDWYRTLNGRVFFWVREERLQRFLNARPYRHQAHLVLEVDTRILVEGCRGRVSLSPINSGSTLYQPQPRGMGTFLSIADYPFDYWRRKRGRADAVVELAVDHAVTEVESVVRSASRWQGPERLGTIWPMS